MYAGETMKATRLKLKDLNCNQLQTKEQGLQFKSNYVNCPPPNENQQTLIREK